LAEALQKGQHVAMLVDQYLTGGVEVTFFGRKTKANPMLARLLRQVECPVHGVRVIRLPGNRFRAELTEEIPPVRDAEGKIDVQGTTQAINNVIEGWIREYPEQWLWLHRRWRGGRDRVSQKRKVGGRCASRRPLLSVTRPSAVPIRRPPLSTTPSARIRPVSGVIGRTNEILNSSVVESTPFASVVWMASPMQLSSSVAVRPPCTVPAGL